MTTHPYYIAKAQDALARAGGDPAHASQLAAWAEAHRADSSVQGVIVALDNGEIMANTWRSQDQVGATYVDRAGTERWGLWANEVGLALGQIQRVTGRLVAHIKRSQVCTGPSPRRV